MKIMQRIKEKKKKILFVSIKIWNEMYKNEDKT